MLFNKCESCISIGTQVCGFESPPRFFCGSHASNHIVSGGVDSFQAALESLTASEVSSIAEAYKYYKLSSIRQAVQIKNSRIEKLLRKIRKAEEECSSILEAIFSGPITREIQQVLSHQALPLFSDSSLVQSLLDLKYAYDFSTAKILDLLKSFNSSILSSFSSFFSTKTSSTQNPPPSTTSVQTSCMPSLFIQSLPSQIDILRMIDPTNYQLELLQQTQAHNDRVISIAVSECEKYVASASFDKTIKILELQTLRPLRILKGHTRAVTSVSFMGNKVVSGSKDRTIKIWKEDRCEKTLNLHSLWVSSVCVSSCKKLIVSGSGDKTAVVFRLKDNVTLHTLTHLYGVESVAFSQNNKEIVSGSGFFDYFDNKGKGEVRIWKTKTGELLNTINAHSGTVTCVNFSGKLIVSSSLDKTLKIWDRDNKKPLLAFSDHTEAIVSVDIRDNVVASLGMDDMIIIRDIRSDTVLQTLQAHGTYHRNSDWYGMGLKVLERGRFIVSGGGLAGEVKVWRRVN